MQIQKKEYRLELETNSRIYIICLIPFKQLNFFSKKKKKREKHDKNCMYVGRNLKSYNKGNPTQERHGKII